MPNSINSSSTPNSPWRPRPATLLPPMTPELEVVLLGRTLWREGYDDHLAGHITIAARRHAPHQPVVLVVGRVHIPTTSCASTSTATCSKGAGPRPPASSCTSNLHKLRDDVNVAVHNHPRFATLWANARRIPPCLDQTSGLGGGKVEIVNEYDGTVRRRRQGAHRAASHRRRRHRAAGRPRPVRHRRRHRRGAPALLASSNAAARPTRSSRSAAGIELARDVLDMLGKAKFDGFWEAMARTSCALTPARFQPPCAESSTCR